MFFVILSFFVNIYASSPYYNHFIDGDDLDYVFNLNLNRLDITNRAACADKSNSPADSAFMIVNAELVGQTAFRIYQNSNKELSEDYFRIHALREFRLRLARLSSYVHESLLSGTLPIIPSKLNNENYGLNKLYNATKDCVDAHCENYNNYLIRTHDYFVYNEQESILYIDESLRDLRQNLSSQRNKHICLYLKKFSPLQLNLLTNAPSSENLTDLARAYEKQQALVTECGDPSSLINNAYYAKQVELKIDRNNKHLFNEIGFDYWHSYKSYLQALWSSDIYLEPLSIEGHSVAFQWFKEIDLGSVLMLSPNQCKNIEEPSCDNSFLAVNSLRELSRFDLEKSIFPNVNRRNSRHINDHTEYVPLGPQHEIIRDPKPEVNSDILNLGKYENSRMWLRNFHQNISRTKSIHNTKLWELVSVYNLLLADLPVDRFEMELERDFNKAKESGDFSGFYYMCTEFAVANSEYLTNLNGAVSDLIKLDVLKEIHPLLDQNKLEEIHTYYSKVSDISSRICNFLSDKDIFTSRHLNVDYKMFRPWLLDHLQLYDVRSTTGHFSSENLVENQSPLLPSSNRVSCSDALDCARLTLEAAIHLYAVSNYAEAFFNFRKEIMSPDLFNPYSERVACDTYDPWKRSRNSFKLLGLDLLNVALFSWNPIPLLIAFDIQEGQVVSFDQLVEDGKIQYTANMTKDKVRASLIARLGPVNGSACQIVIGSSPVNAGEVYPGAYGLIGLNLAYNKTSIQHNPREFEEVNMSRDPSKPLVDSKSRTFGVGCQLFFMPVSKAEYNQLQQRDFSPIKFGVSLIRTIVNFFTYRNHPDMPRSRSYDVEDVYETYRINNGIPKRCVRRLANRGSCFNNRCEQDTVEFMESTFSGDVRRYQHDKWSNRLIVHMSHCSGFYELEVNKNGCFTRRNRRNYQDRIKAFGNCRI